MSDAWVWLHVPQVLPASWRVVKRGLDGVQYTQAFTGLSVIISGSVERDERRWLHLSVAHPSRMPTWTELRSAKETFLGDAYAVSVIPPRALYVNQHPYCLHLFSCVDGHPLPEFTRGGQSL